MRRPTTLGPGVTFTQLVLSTFRLQHCVSGCIDGRCCGFIGRRGAGSGSLSSFKRLCRPCCHWQDGLEDRSLGIELGRGGHLGHINIFEQRDPSIICLPLSAKLQTKPQLNTVAASEEESDSLRAPSVHLHHFLHIEVPKCDRLSCLCHTVGCTGLIRLVEKDREYL